MSKRMMAELEMGGKQAVADVCLLSRIEPVSTSSAVVAFLVVVVVADVVCSSVVAAASSVAWLASQLTVAAASLPLKRSCAVCVAKVLLPWKPRRHSLLQNLLLVTLPAREHVRRPDEKKKTGHLAAGEIVAERPTTGSAAVMALITKEFALLIHRAYATQTQGSVSNLDQESWRTLAQHSQVPSVR